MLYTAAGTVMGLSTSAVVTEMSAATVIASVPFWIPDSMAMVEASDFFNFISLADNRPIESKMMFRMISIGPSVGRFVINTAQFFANAPAMMSMNKMMAARETKGAIRCATSGYLLVTNMPIPTGIAVMQNMTIPSVVTSTGGAPDPKK